uniref:Uncharacterized protein n=1 Tax=Ditylenchus dipsaci TaxID=166011 RepID=A0A915D6A6_9BILA
MLAVSTSIHANIGRLEVKVMAKVNEVAACYPTIDTERSIVSKELHRKWVFAVGNVLGPSEWFHARRQCKNNFMAIACINGFKQARILHALSADPLLFNFGNVWYLESNLL